MAFLYKRRDLSDGLTGYLEDRGTGEIREARLIAHGTKGWTIEIIRPEATLYPLMVMRRYDHYNRVMVEGWRFWDSRPDSNDDKQRWSIL